MLCVINIFFVNFYSTVLSRKGTNFRMHWELLDSWLSYIILIFEFLTRSQPEKVKKIILKYNSKL